MLSVFGSLVECLFGRGEAGSRWDDVPGHFNEKGEGIAMTCN